MYRKRLTVSDILSGSVENFEDLFMIHSVGGWRKKATGEFVLSLILRDETGVLRASFYCGTEEELSEACAKLEKARREGKAVFASGFLEERMGRLEAKLTKIVPLAEDEYEFFQGVPSLSEGAVDSLWRELRNIVDDVLSDGSEESVFGRKLLDVLVFHERMESFFKSAPGAVMYHHAFIGGLLQHTVRVTRTAVLLASETAKAYGDVVSLSLPLIVVGSVLHDIGKIEEYEYTSSYIGRTRVGELHGHVILGAMLVDRVGRHLIRREGRDSWRELLDDVIHVILSHHGRREWGSPVEPAFPEAFIVHYADDLNAKLDHVFGQLSPSFGDKVYSHMLRRNLMTSRWGKRK